MKKEEEKASRFRTTFRLIQRMTWGFILVLVFSFAVYLGNRAYRELQVSSTFRVKTIAIRGNHTLSRKDLIYYLGLNENSNLLTLDLKSLYRKLISHPWIKNASIHRSLPSTLSIDIEERVPVALIKLGKFYYMDKDGVIFDKINKDVGCDFPVFTGPRDFSEVSAYFPLITEALSILNRKTGLIISEFHLDLNHGITLITLNDALPVRLGRKDLSRRFRRFQTVYHYLRRREIPIKTIDCRYPDRVVVKYIHNASEGKREKTG
ncbi:MAG: hypothetical protein DSY91_05210 [Deltaproteobacteria bacterium]|nr:MAG: hypothetical protein DSY91_05210 [Deltaproteobacteria bacterium]